MFNELLTNSCWSPYAGAVIIQQTDFIQKEIRLENPQFMEQNANRIVTSVFMMLNRRFFVSQFGLAIEINSSFFELVKVLNQVG